MSFLNKKAYKTYVSISKKNLFFFSIQKTVNTFKEYFENLVNNTLKNFPTQQKSLKYLHCASITTDVIYVKTWKNLKFEKFTWMSIAKISEEVKTIKATGIDCPAGRFLKNHSKTLRPPAAYTYSVTFPSNSSLSQMLSLYINKVSKLTHRTSAQCRCYHLSRRLQSKLFTIKMWTFY